MNPLVTFISKTTSKDVFSRLHKCCWIGFSSYSTAHLASKVSRPISDMHEASDSTYWFRSEVMKSIGGFGMAFQAFGAKHQNPRKSFGLIDEAFRAI